jgi:hypothetical protein
MANNAIERRGVIVIFADDMSGPASYHESLCCETIALSTGPERRETRNPLCEWADGAAITAIGAKFLDPENLSRIGMTYESVEYEGKRLNEIPDVPIAANVTIRNIGKTPARKVIWNVNLLKFYGAALNDPTGVEKFNNFISAGFNDLSNKNARSRRSLAQYRTESDVAPNDTRFTTYHGPTKLSAKDVGLIRIGDAVTLYYIGAVTYTDAYGMNYQTEFCNYYFGSDPTVWHVCDIHNTIK